nr:hypothetical protein [Kibdelosporangium sp. MJ126-NF4]CTQ93913.1 hypothetical protein [Kibdelosporangium sp. MJ126-NF4]
MASVFPRIIRRFFRTRPGLMVFPGLMGSCALCDPTLT